MVEINSERLLADLTKLRTFGACGSGVVRPTYSEADMSAREWLRSRMSNAGLSATVDGVGNVIGRSPNHGPALIVGSHSDTQPTGGWLDGALGVIYGLEVARSLLESEDTELLAVDIVAWADEEGTYHSCLGSRSFCGQLTEDDMNTATNADGETVAEALERVSLDPGLGARLDLSRHIGYLEAHIEQGPILDEAGQLAGVVTSIVGIRGCQITFTGQQNHAGTTPMARRADAGVALFDFAVRLRERVTDLAGPATVWTIGRAELSPGAASIIPGHAELTLQYRDPDRQRLTAIEAAIEELAGSATAEGPVAVAVERDRDPIAPTVMDDDLTRQIATAAESVVPGRWRHMPSAAGHDPMVLARHLPCGMLFIPSIGGISHDFAEDTADDDIVTGCQILANATTSILRDATRSDNAGD